MIVRNEAKLLPRFLDHVQGLWDELVVVDTGSEDDTVQLIEDAGGRVLHHPWQDDFATPRNVGLAHARGEWILILDPDEFVSPELHDEIRHTIRNPDVGAATLNVSSQLSHGHVRQAALLRLFRNVPEIQFRFPIHEELWSSVNPYLSRNGLKLSRLQGLVDHVGYERERAAERRKKERDLRILKRCVDENPQDLYAYYKLLELARFWDDRPLWKQVARDAARILEDLPQDTSRAAYFGGELLVLIAQGLHPSDEAKALHYVQSRISLVPPSAEVQHYIGQVQERAGQLDLATTAYRQTMEVSTPQLDPQTTRIRPLMGLCRIAITRGDRHSALTYCQEALAAAPRDPEALLALCMLQFENGATAAASAVQAHADRYGPSVELWLAYGDIAMVNKNADQAIRGYEAAFRLSSEARHCLNLAKALVMRGDWQRAHELLSCITDNLPEAGIGLLVCDMCLDQSSNLLLDLDLDKANSLLREWVVTALIGADNLALGNLCRRAPTVGHVFPWLTEVLDRVS